MDGKEGLRLAPAEIVTLLNREGAKISEANILADVAAGAPVCEDGAINLVQYAAWLIREGTHGDGD